MSTETRFASLLAFAESRMAMSSEDCGRDQGRFGEGNTCQAGAGKQASQTALRLRHGIASGAARLTVSKEQLQADRPFRGADKMESLSVVDPKSVAKVARDTFGINDMETPLRIGAAIQPGSAALVSERGYGTIRIESEQPLDASRPELGGCRVKVDITSLGGAKSAHYGYLGVDPKAIRSLDDKKFSERRIASEIMARMLDSMSAGERAGLAYADMIGAGQGTGSGDIDHATGELRGYKLWPTFGFDGEIPHRISASIPADALHPDAATSMSRTGTLTVQQLWLTRKGEEWWKANGSSMAMKFDFKAKDSLGYKRFSRLLGMQARKKTRSEKRSVVEWALYHRVEYRDRQLTLGLSGDNGDDCGRNGGRFAEGNHCQEGGSGLAAPEKHVSATATAIAKSTRRGDASISFTGDQIARDRPFTTTNDIKKLTIEQPKQVAVVGRQMGLKSVESIVRIGAALNDGSDILVQSRSGYSDDTIHVYSTQPVDKSRPELGDCSVHVSLRDNGVEKNVHYDLLQVSDQAAAAIASGKITEHGMGAAVMDRMTDSLQQAEKNGFSYADTYGAGRTGYRAGQMRGYKLWPTFGFDAVLPARFSVPKEVLTEEAKSLVDSGEPLTLQHLIASRAGEEWWEKNGNSINMKLDFKDKNSLGYKRYSRLLRLANRRKTRHARRAFIEWAIYESRGGNYDEYDAIERRSADCNRNEDGEFATGNHCQDEDGQPAAIPRSLTGKKDYNEGSDKLAESPPFPAAAKLENLIVRNPKDVTKIVRDSGVKSYDRLLQITCGDVKGAEVELEGSSGAVTGTVYRKLFPDDEGELASSHAFSIVSVFHDDGKTVVDYHEFNVTGEAVQFLYEDSEESLAARNRVGSEAIRTMVESMTAATKAGVDEAHLMAAGRGKAGGSTPGFKGYRLWPQVGYDGEVPARFANDINDEIRDQLSDDAKASYDSTGTFTVQQLWQSKAGERWWKEKGGPLDLKFDFKDKTSDGYKRYARFKKFYGRSKKRGESRSFVEWVVAGSGVEPSDWPGFPPSAVECRIASLVAFSESRDGDCGRDDGRFAKGNRCQEGADSPQPLPSSSGDFPLAKPEGGRVSSINPSQLRPAIERLGFSSDPHGLATIAVATKKGSVVQATPIANQNGASVTFRTDAPLDIDSPHLGKCEMDVVVKTDGAGTMVEYNWFGLDDTAAQSVANEDYPLHRATSQVIDLMTASLEQAEKSGFTRASTFGAREEWSESAVPQPGELVGFRLWPKFGFDAVLPRRLTREIPNDVLSPRAARKLNTPGQDLTVQDVIESPKGRRWWNENGEADTFELDFKDKSSLGYQRFQKMRSMAERIRREKRSFDIMAWAFLGVFDQDEIERRSSDCGRDSGGRFDGGNKCQSSSDLLSGLEDLLGDHESQTGKDFPDLRYEDGTQTDVARKLHQMKVNETDLAELVKRMGGEPARTRAMIVHPNIHITVVSSQGRDLYHIDLGYEKADIYPTGAASHRLDKINDLATKVFPKAYFRKGTDFHTTTHDDDSAFVKPSRRSLDCRAASLLAFMESRNCGNGAGGFQKGNTCASGAAVDAAKGAAKGALEGALLTTSFSWLPQHIAAGTAVGAGIGAVKGLYDNQMHPTRVMKRIGEIGSSEEKIAEMVKRLGGSPQSSAHLGRKGVSLHIKDKDGNHVFTVDVDKDSAVVYPRRANGELTTSEIDKVKEIAQKGLPSHVDIVVKSKSWHYTAKLARKGFVLTAKTAGSFIASYAGPTVVDTLVGDAAYALAKRFPKKV